MLAGTAELLDPTVREVLASAAELARQRGAHAWLVGGMVRDLCLGRASRDVDLAVEGDGPELARLLGERLGAPVRRHAGFETAHLTWRGVEVDVGSTRSETYPAPAALPRVRPGTLLQDLERRDFTINALATPLGAFPRGEVVDPMGGLGDLERRVLRVHHPRSFEDDPTRVLRGVELEARLDFRLEEESERSAAAAIAAGGLTALSGARLREAWRRAFAAGPPLRRKVGRLDALGALKALGLETPEGEGGDEEGAAGRAAAVAGRLDGLLPRARAVRVDLPPVGDLLILALLGETDRAARLAGALGLSGEPARRLVEWPETARRARSALGSAGSGSAAEEAVEALADGELLALACRLEPSESEPALDVLLRRRPFRLGITGDDLLRRGVPQGPVVGRALAATRRARLDGDLGADEELEHAVRAARREEDAG